MSPPLSPVQSGSSFVSGITFRSSPNKNPLKQNLDENLRYEDVNNRTPKKDDAIQHSFTDDSNYSPPDDSKSIDKEIPSTSALLQVTPKTTKKRPTHIEDDATENKKPKIMILRLKDDTSSGRIFKETFTNEKGVKVRFWYIFYVAFTNIINNIFIYN